VIILRHIKEFLSCFEGNREPPKVSEPGSEMFFFNREMSANGDAVIDVWAPGEP
jgi:hypothetical protein